MPDYPTPTNGDMPQFDFGTDTELVEAVPFLAEIVTDTWTKSDKAGIRNPWQYHLAIKPLEYTVGGQTGAYHSFYNTSTVKRSKMGMFLASYKKAFPKGIESAPNQGKKIGYGDLVGTTAWFTRRDVNFGQDRDSGQERVAKGLILFERAATPEEIANAATPGSASTPSAPTYSESDIQTLLLLVNGKTTAEIQKAAIRDRELSAELKNALTSGTAMHYLTSNNLVEFDGDVVMVKTPATA